MNSAPLPASSDNNVVKNARIYNNGAGKAWGGTSTCGSNGGGIVLSDVNNIAYNNLIYGNLIGVAAFTGAKTAIRTKIYNNTVYNNVVGIQIFSGSSNVE